MVILQHDDQQIHRVRRIATRILTGSGSHSQHTTVWQQWLEAGDFIPEHYHDIEEVLLIVRGSMELTLDGERQIVRSPATVVIAPQLLHSMRPQGLEQVQMYAIFPDGDPRIFAADGSPRPLPWEDHLA